MKRLIKKLGYVALFAALIGMGSCEEAKEVIPLPSMKATVDGQAWTSIFRATVLNNSTTPQSIVITGTPTANETADKTIVLTIKGTEAGTYTLESISLNPKAECLVVYKKAAGAAEGDDNYYASYEATITITSIDSEKQRVSGTFSAKCINTALTPDEVNITSGTFENLNYINN